MNKCVWEYWGEDLDYKIYKTECGHLLDYKNQKTCKCGKEVEIR